MKDTRLAVLLNIWPFPLGLGYLYLRRWVRFGATNLLACVVVPAILERLLYAEVGDSLLARMRGAAIFLIWAFTWFDARNTATSQAPLRAQETDSQSIPRPSERALDPPTWLSFVFAVVFVVIFDIASLSLLSILWSSNDRVTTVVAALLTVAAKIFFGVMAVKGANPKRDRWLYYGVMLVFAFLPVFSWVPLYYSGKALARAVSAHGNGATTEDALQSDEQSRDEPAFGHSKRHPTSQAQGQSSQPHDESAPVAPSQTASRAWSPRTGLMVGFGLGGLFVVCVLCTLVIGAVGYVASNGVTLPAMLSQPTATLAPIVVPLPQPPTIETPTPMPTQTPVPRADRLTDMWHEVDYWWERADWPRVVRLVAEIESIEGRTPRVAEKLYAAYYNYGMSLLQSGRRNEAGDALNLALSAKPDGIEAREALLSLTPRPSAPVVVTKQPAPSPYNLKVIVRSGWDSSFGDYTATVSLQFTKDGKPVKFGSAQCWAMYPNKRLIALPEKFDTTILDGSGTVGTLTETTPKGFVIQVDCRASETTYPSSEMVSASTQFVLIPDVPCPKGC